MIGFTDCCHHRGRVKFVSAQLLRHTGAMEPPGLGGRGSVLQSRCLGEGGGASPALQGQLVPCRSWLQGSVVMLSARVPSSALPSPAPAGVCVCSHGSSPSIAVSCFLAFSQRSTDACAGSSRRTGVSGRRWLSTGGASLDVADLGLREVHIQELSCHFLQFSLHVYNIAINSTGEEIPSKKCCLQLPSNELGLSVQCV